MELLSGFLLILISGFFAGSETAIYRANWIRLTNWRNRHLSGSAQALRVLENRESTLTAMLVGTNLCNVFATIFFARYFSDQFGPAYATLAVASVVVLTLVLGEFLPKALAQAVPDRWLRRAALIINASRIAFAPAVLLLSGIGRLFARPIARSGQRFTLTKEDLIAALDRHVRRLTIAERRPALDPSSLVQRLFRFSSLRVREVAIPLEQVKSVSTAAGLNEVFALISQFGYSRIPVYESTPENIVGVIVAKDLLAAPTYRVRKVNHVQDNTRAMEVLRTMQQSGEHLTLVTDPADRVRGIVTLEDLLEELVGEIRSEA